MEYFPPLNLGVVANEKGAFRSLSTRVTNFTFTFFGFVYIYIYIYIYIYTHTENVNYLLLAQRLVLLNNSFISYLKVKSLKCKVDQENGEQKEGKNLTKQKIQLINQLINLSNDWLIDWYINWLSIRQKSTFHLAPNNRKYISILIPQLTPTSYHYHPHNIWTTPFPLHLLNISIFAIFFFLILFLITAPLTFILNLFPYFLFVCFNSLPHINSLPIQEWITPSFQNTRSLSVIRLFDS